MPVFRTSYGCSLTHKLEVSEDDYLATADITSNHQLRVSLVPNLLGDPYWVFAQWREEQYRWVPVEDSFIAFPLEDIGVIVALLNKARQQLPRLAQGQRPAA